MAETRVTGLDEQLCRRVIKLVRTHRFDETQIVDLPFEMRQSVGNPLPALSCLMKRILRAEQLRDAVDECEAFSDEEGGWAILAVEAGQFGFVFEKFELAGGSRHMEIDDALCSRRKLRRQNGEWSFGITSEIEARRSVRIKSCCLR